jgi:hypothetical protein
MGFMDKLRSVASAVTGGGAKVQLEIVNPKRDQPFTVNVQATVSDKDLKVDKVYLKLIGEETVSLDVQTPKEGGGTKTEKKSNSATTFQQELELAGAQTLNAKQTYTWSGQVQLPTNAKPTYDGVNARHEWKLLAGLSTFGNDPDSGWQTLAV